MFWRNHVAIFFSFDFDCKRGIGNGHPIRETGMLLVVGSGSTSYGRVTVCLILISREATRICWQRYLDLVVLLVYTIILVTFYIVFLELTMDNGLLRIWWRLVLTFLWCLNISDNGVETLLLWYSLIQLLIRVYILVSLVLIYCVFDCIIVCHLIKGNLPLKQTVNIL